MKAPPPYDFVLFDVEVCFLGEHMNVHKAILCRLVTSGFKDAGTGPSHSLGLLLGDRRIGSRKKRYRALMQ